MRVSERNQDVRVGAMFELMMDRADAQFALTIGTIRRVGRVNGRQSVFSLEGRAFLVWRRGGKTSGRGETVVAATVDEKRLGRNRDPGAALWGLNRGGCRGGRGTRPCGGRHGNWCRRSPPVGGVDERRADTPGTVLRSCDEGWRYTSAVTRRACRDRRRAARARAGHEVSGSAGYAHPRSQETVTIMWPSAQTGHVRRETPVRDS